MNATHLRPPLADTAGIYREWAPPAPLRADVRCLWTNRIDASAVPASAVLVVPDGCIDIVWAGGGLRVAGPDTRAIRERVPEGGAIAGLRFQPGAAAPWLGSSAEALLDARPQLEAFWGRAAGRLAERLAEAGDPAEAARLLAAALLARNPRTAPDPRMRAMLASAMRARGSLNLRSLARALDMGERTLRRRSREAFGYGPKTLHRILRFQRFLRLLRRSPWARLADLALAAGFADQAHLAREVRRLTGMTPGAFAAAFQR